MVFKRSIKRRKEVINGQRATRRREPSERCRKFLQKPNIYDRRRFVRPRFETDGKMPSPTNHILVKRTLTRSGDHRSQPFADHSTGIICVRWCIFAHKPIEIIEQEPFVNYTRIFPIILSQDARCNLLLFIYK